MSAALDGLIARLEAATEGSRELDCAIYRTLGGKLGREIRHTNGTYITTEGDESVPHYTTSLDAVMLLVPEGWWVSRINQYHTNKGPMNSWGVHLRHMPPWEFGEVIGEHGLAFRDGPPAAVLAFCIAALKAHNPVQSRHHQDEDGTANA